LPIVNGQANPWPLFVALLGIDVVEQRLLELGGRTRGLPLAERGPKIAELTQQRIEREHQEERLVLAAIDGREDVLRRIDVDPVSVLEVWAEEDAA
jgi:hypothetical protein